MLKVIAFIKRKPGTTHAEFRKYYESTHRHQVKHLVKVAEKATWSFPRKDYDDIVNSFHHPEWNGRNEDDVIYDSVTELWLKDEAALKKVYEILNSAVVNPEIRGDEEQFMDQTDFKVQVYDEVVGDLSEY